MSIGLANGRDGGITRLIEAGMSIIANPIKTMNEDRKPPEIVADHHGLRRMPTQVAKLARPKQRGVCRWALLGTPKTTRLPK